MSRNQTGGTELIPMPCPTEAAQLSLPIILYSAVYYGQSQLVTGGQEGDASDPGQLPRRLLHHQSLHLLLARVVGQLPEIQDRRLNILKD